MVCMRLLGPGVRLGMNNEVEMTDIRFSTNKPISGQELAELRGLDWL